MKNFERFHFQQLSWAHPVLQVLDPLDPLDLWVRWARAVPQAKTESPEPPVPLARPESALEWVKAPQDPLGLPESKESQVIRTTNAMRMLAIVIQIFGCSDRLVVSPLSSRRSWPTRTPGASRRRYPRLR